MCVVPLGFDFFLIAMCTLYAIKTRNVPENFNEAKFIGFTMYTTLVIWIAFVAIYLSNSEHKVTLLSLCISFSALFALFLLFLPKCYIIIFKPEKNNRSFFTTTNQVRCHIGFTATNNNNNNNNQLATQFNQQQQQQQLAYQQPSSSETNCKDYAMDNSQLLQNNGHQQQQRRRRTNSSSLETTLKSVLEQADQLRRNQQTQGNPNENAESKLNSMKPADNNNNKQDSTTTTLQTSDLANSQDCKTTTK